MLELKDRQIAAIKRQYRNSLPAIKKIESLKKKINELSEELEREMAYLEGGEAGIRALTGGYNSYDLIKCEYIPQFNEDGTPKMDKEGKYQIKKQVLTFVQPTEVPVPVMGNDFDADPCGCDSMLMNMGMSEEEWNKAQEFIAEDEARQKLLRAGELKPEDYFKNESLNSGVGVNPANDNPSTEATNESL